MSKFRWIMLLPGTILSTIILTALTALGGGMASYFVGYSFAPIYIMSINVMTIVFITSAVLIAPRKKFPIAVAFSAVITLAYHLPLVFFSLVVPDELLKYHPEMQSANQFLFSSLSAISFAGIISWLTRKWAKQNQEGVKE